MNWKIHFGIIRVNQTHEQYEVYEMTFTCSAEKLEFISNIFLFRILPQQTFSSFTVHFISLQLKHYSILPYVTSYWILSWSSEIARSDRSLKSVGQHPLYRSVAIEIFSHISSLIKAHSSWQNETWTASISSVSNKANSENIETF